MSFRVMYMGTPDFAVPPLTALVEAGYDVVGVVTQPDKPKGRGKTMMPTPVKEEALKHGIPVYQPEKVRAQEFVDVLTEINPDIIVVAAFGQIIPKVILELPQFGCINIHASLLPKYRGAAPIQQAVIDGEKESGVTIMKMGMGLDTGDMISKIIVPITAEETGGSLFDKLSALGGELILSTLEKMENGTITRTPQGDSTTSYAKMLKKTMGEIDWHMEAVKIERLIRGLNPWPSAYTSLKGKTVKIWSADVVAGESTGNPGRVTVTKDKLLVECGENFLSITELQLEGKKRMETAAFLRGFTVEDQTVFGL